MTAFVSAPVAGIALAVAVACAIAPAAAKPKADNLVPSGKAVSCVILQSIRSTQVRDDRTIDFIMNGNKVYRNQMKHSCPGLGSERRFLYKTSLSQLCSVDIITVLYNTPNLNPGASCGLGMFQPMVKAPK